MNVKNSPLNLPQVSGVIKTEAISDGTRSPQTAVSNGEDRAEVSVAANLASLAMTVPDVRMSKVDAVQKSIADGTYDVSAATLADKLIAQMQGR